MRVLFRFKPDDKKAWIGFAEGRTWEEIFWNIDEFGDPYTANVIKLPHKYRMSFCIPVTNDDEEEGWGSVNEDREIGESFWMATPEIDDLEWETKVPEEWKEFLEEESASVDEVVKEALGWAGV